MSPPKRTIRTFGSDAEPGDNSVSSERTSFLKSRDTFSSSGRPSSSNSVNMTVALSDQELIDIDIKDLNDYLRRLPKDAASNARKRRRLLKNRGYAQSTRTKRMTSIEEYSARKMELKAEIASIRRESERLRAKREQLQLAKLNLERQRSQANMVNPVGDILIKTEEDVI